MVQFCERSVNRKVWAVSVVIETALEGIQGRDRVSETPTPVSVWTLPQSEKFLQIYKICKILIECKIWPLLVFRARVIFYQTN